MTNTPDRLYKYCSSKVYEEKIAHGQIQFGRASYYRQKFLEGAGFGDEFEGAPFYDLKRDVVGRDANLSKSLYENTSGRCLWLGSFSVRTGVRFTIEMPDLFLFSLSMQYCPITHKHFAQKDGYDLCLVMTDLLGFSKTLMEVTHTRFGDFAYSHPDTAMTETCLRAAKVNYVDLGVDIESRTRLDAFTKDRARFGGEAEFRLTLQFNPDVSTPDPNFFRPQDKRLGHYFKRYRNV